MRRTRTVAATLCVVLGLSACGQKAVPVLTRAAVDGDLRIHELSSRVFGNRRAIRVLVPQGYDAPENRARRYPVLYLNDGQNLFDRATATCDHRAWARRLPGALQFLYSQ